MAYFLLAWNPSRFSEVDFEDLAVQLQQGVKVEIRWSVTRSKRTSIGDKFYIIKLGNKGRGIFGSGSIVSEPQEDLHYDPKKAADGSKLLYVNIQFDRLISANDVPLIGIDDLEQINVKTGVNQAWTPHGSGIEINELAALALTGLWRERTENIERIDIKQYLGFCGDLDVVIETTRRREQAFLKNTLFGVNKFAECSICQMVLPVQFLVCAHIKKRSECSEIEKRDINNIVTPMCRFGCDELYERGYISVHNGVIVDNSIGVLMDKVSIYMKGIVGKKCTSYHVGVKKDYYEWHHLKHCSTNK